MTLYHRVTVLHLTMLFAGAKQQISVQANNAQASLSLPSVKADVNTYALCHRICIWNFNFEVVFVVEIITIHLFVCCKRKMFALHPQGGPLILLCI